jgi:chemotaxis protein MotB
MARKRKPEEHANHERWLVSYADFITLLFAFFVVMFAVSQVDEAKVGRFTESVQAATRWGLFDKSGAPGIVGGRAKSTTPARVPELRGTRKTGAQAVAALRARLEPRLREAIAAGRIALIESDEGLIVRLHEAAFFPSGSAEIREQNAGELQALGRWIGDLSNAVRIEGHTDSRPIRTAVYRSNWDLSAARAGSVLQVLVAGGHVSEGRLSVAGYADRRPVGSNQTEDGRRQNRRVDLVILTEQRPGPPAAASGP